MVLELAAGIGLVASIAQIAGQCLVAVQTLEHTRQKIQHAPIVIESLCSESQLVHSSLVELEYLFQDGNNKLAAALRAKPQVFASLERVLASCQKVYTCLDKELKSTTGAPRLILKERVLKEYLEQIRGHQTTLTLLIQGIQMHSLDMIYNILASIQMMSPQIPARSNSVASLGDETYVPDEFRAAYFDNEPMDPSLTPSPLSPQSTPSLTKSMNGLNIIERGESLSPPRLKQYSHANLPPLPPAALPVASDKYAELYTDNPWEDTPAGPAAHTSVTSTPSWESPPASQGSSVHARDRIRYEAAWNDSADTMKIVIIPEESAEIARYSSASLSPNAEVLSAISGNGNARMSVSRHDSIQSRGSTYSEFDSLPEVVGPAASSIFPELSHRTEMVPPQSNEMCLDLESRRRLALQSIDTTQQLDWAEQALHYVYSFTWEVKAAKRERNRQTFSAVDKLIEADAVTIVDEHANRGDGRALYLKAKWLLSDGAERHSAFQQALSKGYIRAAYHVGQISEEKKDKKEKKQAAGYYWQGQSAGDPASTYRIAEAFLDGDIGIKKDHRQAVSLMRNAAAHADMNFPDALYRLAELQTTELRKAIKISKSDLPIDEIAARENYLKAARLLHPPALLFIGKAYQTACLGFHTDAASSMHYLRLASRAGMPEADFAISNWFWFGQQGQMPENHEMAFKFARKAAEGGFAPAFCQVGYFYEIGLGIEKKDYFRAKEWYLKGIARGDGMARKRLDGLMHKIRTVI